MQCAPTVVHIITKLELGGAQKTCLALASKLPSYSINTILISGAKGLLVAEAKTLPNTFFLESFKREIGIRLIFDEIKTFFVLIATLKKLKLEHKNLIVHTHSTKAGLIGRWAAFFAKIPYRIHTIHGYGFNDYQPILIWLTIYFLEFITSSITTHYICVSRRDQEQGIRLFPCFSRRNSLIRAAVDKNYFTKIPSIKKIAPPTTIIIGAVACFKPAKNLFDLLRAFHHLISQTPINVRLQIIGDGALRPAIERWIELHAMSPYIDLLGWKKHIAPWLSKWQIFALSSLWEGLPCAIVEARLSKLPIVAYDVGGISEIVQQGENGYIVQPGNWQELAEKMLLIVTNTTLRKKMADFNDNLSDFYLETMLQKHTALYKKMLKGKNSPSPI